MTKPEVIRYGDGHYRRTIWGIGPYIADYPEQVLLCCIVQGWCPKCTAPAKNLDHGKAGRRSHEHTRVAMNALGVKALWDDYGIIAGTLVHLSYISAHLADINYSRSLPTFHALISMS